MLTREELLTLTASEEFQEIFRADPVLDELEKQKYDRTAEVFNLLAALGQRSFSVGALSVQPITAALWSMLWALDNGFTRDGGGETTQDVEVALYLLSHGVRRMDCTLTEIPRRAAGTIAASGMNEQEAAGEVRSMIALAFRPLACFPRQSGGGSSVQFDALWLAQIGGIGVREAGVSFRRAIYDLPLSLLHYFAVAAAQRNDTRNAVYRRGDEEINKSMLERAYALGEKFLIEKGLKNACGR